MNPSKTYGSIGKITASYRGRLARMDEELFITTPPIGGWSYAEVYSHIFDASLLSLMALNKAVSGEGEDKSTHLAVQLILLWGSFPPAKRYEVPSRLAGRVKKIGKMAAEQFITDFELQLAKNFPQVNGASSKSKVKHPRMGYLNAKQWLRFIEIHLKHHLKQLERIEKSFRQQ